LVLVILSLFQNHVYIVRTVIVSLFDSKDNLHICDAISEPFAHNLVTLPISEPFASSTVLMITIVSGMPIKILERMMPLTLSHLAPCHYKAFCLDHSNA
jgi:hypothetical protein